MVPESNRGEPSRKQAAASATRLFASACLLAATWLASGSTEVLDPAALTAGSFTTPEAGANAFSIPIAMLDKEQAAQFAKGREQFHEAWVVAPDPGGVWGLGPTFNEDRCAHCHENNGRAGAPAERQEAVRGMLVRLSLPGLGPHGEPRPHPAYGDQLQNRGIPGRVTAEGRAILSYAAREVGFADSETATLRVPKIEFAALQFGELGADIMISLRIAPAMVGLGLLEAVPEQTILAIAREQEKLGVSGKPNYVWDYENGRTVLGRFGWKAGQPNLRQQTAAAFLNDIGATSHFFPEENCPSVQVQCLDVPSASKCGGQGGCTGNYRPEVIPSRLNNITLYLQALAVPARRNVNDPEVKRGEGLFSQANCSACHVPELRTGGKTAIPAAADLAIHAYTDLLLHDMGEGLADGRPEYQADGREWRTPPLWGIGLLREVNGHGDLLHDGRARNVTEAIFWHGGEAEQSREAFRALTKADREALLKFVNSI
ncbi:MAG TPA: di-heme oxidoredictase family protein [Burkholderiales bacterium]|nr:di-heme oxidoredictase family protein [Burkholderiales bacterium]